MGKGFEGRVEYVMTRRYGSRLIRWIGYTGPDRGTVLGQRGIIRCHRYTGGCKIHDIRCDDSRQCTGGTVKTKSRPLK